MLSLDPEAAASLLAEVLETSTAGTAIFWSVSRRAPTKWRMPSPHTPPSPGSSASWSEPISCTSIHSRRPHSSIPASSHIPTSPALPQAGFASSSAFAVGEGHISSLTFRFGSVAAGGEVSVDPTSRLATIATLHNRMARLDGEDVEVAFAADSDISERVIFP